MTYKAIQSELAIHGSQYKAFDMWFIPKDGNNALSYRFFSFEVEGKYGTRKLNFRLVFHGHRDSEKDSVRTDSSIAQIPVMRVELSAVSLRKSISKVRTSEEECSSGTSFFLPQKMLGFDSSFSPQIIRACLWNFGIWSNSAKNRQ